MKETTAKCYSQKLRVAKTVTSSLLIGKERRLFFVEQKLPAVVDN